MSWNEIPSKYLFTKNDPDDPRIGEWVHRLKDPFDSNSNSNKQYDLFIVGYPDDEGIKINGGITGAALGPNSIRHFLYRMTPPVSQPHLPIKIGDLGNLTLSGSIEDRHNLAREGISSICKTSKKWISLGGGHDYGFPDGAGFLDHFLKSHINGPKPVIINFDAHLDVRPTTNGYNSGTAFYRLLNEFENQFHFFQIGIQPQCNSRTHLNWCSQKGASILLYEDDLKGNLAPSVLSLLKKTNLKNHPTFISLDIDVFSNTWAPGCSQSWATGIDLHDFIQTLYKLKNYLNICGLGIYEVAPPLDVNNQTSKLAALLAYRFIFS